MNALALQDSPQPELSIVEPHGEQPPDSELQGQAALPVCIDTDADLLKPDGSVDELRENTVVNKMMTRYRTYRDHPLRKQYEHYWDICDKAYMGWVPYRDGETVVIREVLKELETLKPQISKALTWGDQMFTFKPRQEGFDDQAQGATAIIHDQIQRHGTKQQIQAWIDEACLFGTSYIVYGWRHFKQTRGKSESMHAAEQDTWWDKKTYEVVEEAPYAEHISCWDILTDPYVEEAKNSSMVFFARHVTGDDLKTLIREGYLDGPAVKRALGPNDGGIYHDDRSHAWDDLGFLDALETTHEMLRCWTFDGREYVVIDGTYIVRAMPLERGVIPIETLRLMPRPGRHFGIPMPMVIMGEQQFLNEVMSLLIKGMRYSLVPLVVGTQDAIDAWRSSVIRPGQGIAVNNVTDIQALELPDKTPGIEKIIALTLNNMSRGSGLPDVISGTGTSGTNTATGQVHLQDAAGDRLNHIVYTFKPPFICLFQAFYNLNAMNQQKVYDMQIAGPDGGNVFEHYTPEVFDPSVDCELELGGPDGIQMANAWLNVAKNVIGHPLVDPKPLLLEIFKAMGVTRPKSFLAAPSASAQMDALMLCQQLEQTGICTDAKPNDNHQVYVQVLSMFMQTMSFGAMPPEWQQRTEGRLQQHQFYLQQEMMANQQMQQAPASQPQPGATPVGQEGNANAQGLFDMAGSGADQQGAGG